MRGKLPKQKPKAKARKPVHGTQPGDKVSGDRLFVSCQKPDNWAVYRKSGQHRGSYAIARKDAMAVVEQAYTNVRR